MFSKPFILFTLCAYISCNSGNGYSASQASIDLRVTRDTGNETNPYSSIKEIPLPTGYERIKNGDDSFGNWLINLKLKENKTVYKFDGRPKANQAAQFAVVDISVGDRDLQQCADAIMRLRAEYLFTVKKYRDIYFKDIRGAGYRFQEPWTSGNLYQYLKKVFAMCGSASLSKQLKNVSTENVKAGDVLIRGGFPGHAVIVIDVAVNSLGNKIYLLAQSYMPAQDIHVLINPENSILSPWYDLNDDELIKTPEYTFRKDEFKTW